MFSLRCYTQLKFVKIQEIPQLSNAFGYLLAFENSKKRHFLEHRSKIDINSCYLSF